MPALDTLTFRSFRGRDDYQGISDLINERVAVEGEGERSTVAKVAEHLDHLVRCDPLSDIVIAEDGAGHLVGYARVFWADVIDDGCRAYHIARQASHAIDGLGELVLRWGVERCTAIASGHDHQDKRIRVSSVVGGRDEVAIAAVGGFTPFAWSAYMVRSHLLDIPDQPLPAGLELRPVESVHLRAIWEADVEAFRDAPGFVEQTDEDWDRFQDEAAQGTALWQVAWDGESVAGQVRTRINDGEAERLGRRRAWTEDISTRRDWRGRGVASGLIASSLRQLASLGFDEAALSVDLDNPTGALGVYERLGYQVVQRHTSYERRL